MKFLKQQLVISENSIYILVRLLPIIVVILFSKVQAAATDIFVEMAVGHDDNVTQSPEPTSSMFFSVPYRPFPVFL